MPMKELDAVEIPTHETGFILSIDKDDWCYVVGAEIDMRIPMRHLKPLGFTLKEFLSKHELVR